MPLTIQLPAYGLLTAFFFAGSYACATPVALPFADESADWGITLASPEQAGPPGSTIIYSGTIFNLTGADLFLNTARLNFSPGISDPAYAKDYTDEFLSTLGVIPVSGYTGTLFYVHWLDSAPSGASGAGTFELTAEISGAPVSRASPFKATVSNAPEPGTWLLVSCALILIGLRAYYRN